MQFNKNFLLAIVLLVLGCGLGMYIDVTSRVVMKTEDVVEKVELDPTLCMGGYVDVEKCPKIKTESRLSYALVSRAKSIYLTGRCVKFYNSQPLQNYYSNICVNLKEVKKNDKSFVLGIVGEFQNEEIHCSIESAKFIRVENEKCS